PERKSDVTPPAQTAQEASKLAQTVREASKLAQTAQEPPKVTTVQSRPAAERSEMRTVSFVPKEAGRQDSIGTWTVQAGVFTSLQQAVLLRKQLADKGFEAQVSPTAAGGQVRYRVRVGAFSSKDDAVRAAERVRSDRPLTTYVTTTR